MTFYDNFELLSCQTSILAEKDGYYSFENTVFYGEKGGQLSDRGTINGLEVLDLKWEKDILWHKVEGVLADPIVMKVDEKTRWINTSVQTVFHLLDGFYEEKGLKVTAVHANPSNQWYEINSKTISDDLLLETENFINHIIKEDIPVTFSYMKGEDYPDPAYHGIETLRLVEIGQINSQACGTCHVNHTGQIGAFTILGKEKSSKGSRIQIAVGEAVSQLLKQDRLVLNSLSSQLSSSRNDLEAKAAELLKANKDWKKNFQDVKKQLLAYQAQDLLKDGQAIIKYQTTDPGDLMTLSQLLEKEVNQDSLIWAPIDKLIYFAILSPQGQARDLFAKIKLAYPTLSGGGSPKIVSGKIELDEAVWLSILEEIMKGD